MIAQETVDAVYEAAEIVEVVSDFLTLKKRGVNYIGSCPFHNEKTSSFTVSPAKQIYKCFGCGKGGNPVTFIMEHDKLSYPEAIHWLANKYNIAIEENFTDQQREDKLVSENILKVNKYALDFFRSNLNSSPEAIKYFTDRGFSQETLEKFSIGYAVNSDHSFQDKLTADGLDFKHSMKADLLYGRDGRVKDRFQERLMFPIHSITGSVVGFGGRVWTAEQKEKKIAKYVNTSENEVYHKSSVLYGLYFAKKAISSENECWVVEGYADVISLHQGGIEHVVASSGTSLSQQQVKIIKRFTNNIVFLFDGDAAGVKATGRAIEIATEEGMNIRLVLFKDGDDPDSYIQAKGAEGLRAYVDANKGDLVDFYTVTAKDTTPEQKDATMRMIMTVISKIPEGNFAKVQEYIRKVSKHYRIAEDKLGAFVSKERQRMEQGEGLPADLSEKDPEIVVSKHELEYIRVLMLYGSHTYNINKPCCTFMMERGGLPENFENETIRAIFQKYYDCLVEGFVPAIDFFIKSENKDIAELATNLAFDQYQISENWEGVVIPQDEVLKQVRTAVSYLRMHRFKELLAKNKALLKEEKDPAKVTEILTSDQNVRQLMKAEAETLGITVFK